MLPDRVALKPDLEVLDSEGRPLLCAEVKAGQITAEDRSYWTARLRRRGVNYPFVMFADSDKIELYRWEGGELAGPALSLSAATVLKRYEPDFGTIPLYEFYLETLVESWLTDLVCHWKGPVPPAEDDLRKVGLLDRLHQGVTVNREGDRGRLGVR